MSHASISAHQNRLSDLFKNSAVLGLDIETQSHWARYLCVLSCGFIEVSIRTILEDYVKNHASTQIANYTHTQLTRFYNPTTNKILSLIQSFDLTWKQSLEKEITGEMKDALDSIVNNKNTIVHGQPTGITFLTIKTYFEQACKTIAVLEKLVI